MLGGFVDLRSESPEPATALEPVELPELDNGPHFFYGLQWWFFGALAIFGFFYLIYDEWRGRPRPAAATGTPPAPSRRAAAATNASSRRRDGVPGASGSTRGERATQSARSSPPSTGSITPVRNDAAGDSTKAATRPNSSGSP